MAEFKRVNDQYTVSFEAYYTTGGKLSVGTVVAYNPNTKAITLVDGLDDAVTAKGNGNEIFIIAQSDAVTEKTGTPYKTYTISDEVDFTNHTSSGNEKTITGYLVKDITNIVF